ncbi:hypothetical protein D3C71_2077200 [compost metagenome]
MQHHDLDQRAGMERGRRGVEADIGADRTLDCSSVQALRIGDLVDIAALGEGAEQIGFEGGHVGYSMRR